MPNNLKIRPVDDIDRKNLKSVVVSLQKPKFIYKVYRKALIGSDGIGEALRRGTTCTGAC
jgi:hypothetical protein